MHGQPKKIRKPTRQDFIAAVREWRHESRGCPLDEDIVAYSEGRLGLKSFAVWWHVRRCVLCQADISRLREKVGVGKPNMIPSLISRLVTVGVATVLLVAVPISWYAGRHYERQTIMVSSESKSLERKLSISGLSAEDIMNWLFAPPKNPREILRSIKMLEAYLQEHPENAGVRLRLLELYADYQTLVNEKERRKVAGKVEEHRRQLLLLLRKMGLSVSEENQHERRKP